MFNRLVQENGNTLCESKSQDKKTGLDCAASNKPRVSILNPSFKWTNSAKTDLRKTFARIRRQLAEKSNVQPMRKKEVLNAKI